MVIYLQKIYGAVAGDLLERQEYREFEVEPVVEAIMEMLERLQGAEHKARR